MSFIVIYRVFLTYFFNNSLRNRATPVEAAEIQAQVRLPSLFLSLLSNALVQLQESESARALLQTEIDTLKQQAANTKRAHDEALAEIRKRDAEITTLKVRSRACFRGAPLTFFLSAYAAARGRREQQEQVISPMMPSGSRHNCHSYII
mgnify:CR=1 FL=1